MSRTFKSLFLALSLALAGFTVAGTLGVHASSNNDDGAYRQLGVYSEVMAKIKGEYVEEPSISTVTNGALHGLLESLDANSSYLTPAEYKELKALKEAKGNIGAAISKRLGYAVVVSVVPGGPADKAGVNNGDIIEAIEGKSSHEISLAEIKGMMSGQPGSNITVSVVRPRKAEPLKLTITRDIVKEPSATWRMIDDQIGYIKADTLSPGRAQEIARAVADLQNKGAKKLILDLRNNGDGDMNEGVATANLFLNHGTIGYVQGQKFPKQAFNVDASKAVTAAPLVVLVNRSTAGPSELAAAAILENARGDVLGDKTFGSGSIQKTIPLQDGSALILSIAKYYSPSGKALQDSSVTPNILVADNSDDLVIADEDVEPAPEAEQPKEKKSDDQLNRAIEVLKNKDKKAAAAAPAPETKAELQTADVLV
jgi:carboxyl-terminal processing protease